jgi:hypothetical protein
MPTPTTTERTWRVQVFTDRGADPRIEFLRQRVTTYENGDTVERDAGVVSRSLSQVKDQPLPGGARTVRTLGELFALVGECGHALAAEAAAALAAEEAKAAAAAEQAKAAALAAEQE